MSISRDVCLEELKLTRQHLDQWINELEHPSMVDAQGNVHEVPDEQIPEHIPISQMRTVPREQFKSELAMMAGKLEVLATAV